MEGVNALNVDWKFEGLLGTGRVLGIIIEGLVVFRNCLLLVVFLLVIGCLFAFGGLCGNFLV